MVKRVAKWLIIGLGAGFLLIQLVPYGRDHSNPPVTKEAPWTNSSTRALAMEACGDCHSNQTRWPWYTNIAPVSWLTQHDVEDGRGELNFSEWNKPQEGKSEAAEQVRSGEMPPLQYKIIHPEARLSDKQRAELAAEFQKMSGP